MMYSKSPKMTSSKAPKKPKSMPLTIMVAVGKGMPTRGSRTAKNMMKKTGKSK